MIFQSMQDAGDNFLQVNIVVRVIACEFSYTNWHHTSGYLACMCQILMLPQGKHTNACISQIQPLVYCAAKYICSIRILQHAILSKNMYIKASDRSLWDHFCKSSQLIPLKYMRWRPAKNLAMMLELLCAICFCFRGYTLLSFVCFINACFLILFYKLS